ncbi:hypothetical protein EV426DRAFT_574798 [Tirmania nivea]|nr:hypothetical protein EV426DRAFT_574798 [Tirmania nivea]
MDPNTIDDFPPLTSTTLDLRTPSVAPLRRRAHLKKYYTTNLPTRASPKPIPFSHALTLPATVLVPELSTWESLGISSYRYDYLLHPNNTPNNLLTARGQRRRVFDASRIAASFVWGNHCTCLGCKQERRQMNQKAWKATYTRWEVEDGFLEKAGMGGDEQEIKVGAIPWWMEGHRGEDEDDGCGDLSMQTLSPARDAWAKLVDDAVGVWEGKRRRCVEELGWEVCSDVGARVRACSPSGWSECGEEVGGEDEDGDWDKVYLYGLDGPDSHLYPMSTESWLYKLGDESRRGEWDVLLNTKSHSVFVQCNQINVGGYLDVARLNSG